MKTWARLFVGSVLLGLPARAAEDLGGFLMHHMADSQEWKVTPWGPTLHLPSGWNVFGMDMAVSQHVLMMLIAGTLLTLLLLAARKRAGFAPAGRFGHAVEVLVLFIRDEVVRPNLGDKDTPKWLPFFLTLFFFLLSINLIGLVPGFSSAGSNINITAALAIMTFCIYNGAGMARNGVGHYFAALVPKGLPVLVLPLIAVIEFIGLFTKAFALAIRLFANMTAGHVLILSLLGLIAVFKSYLLIPPFLGFTLFIYLIELLVAFLQAYVFTLLASLFVGMALHPEH
jgi:F-type H+-transporting ATPase subunit a